ncbi:short-chain dehydrogenase [Rhizorhabdus wittichii]|uniref:Short-chain dehydrogenase n=1 Tax=Rhizorhabdus wittichii TaxID=160791 RepID=A0A975D6U1_9SPHN|nr:zinc ribbon domain-containing protein [Rhizorhabdus wittichii]QTH23991.1 short-chain dehydrogenase [Rhizorhabdus wittichii]
MSGGDALLQHCRVCGTALYPRREICSHCLSGDLADVDVAGAPATMIALTTLHITHEPPLRPLLPLRIGTVVLEEGPKLIVYAAPAVATGDAVVLSVVADPDGVPVMVAAGKAIAASKLADALNEGEEG